jgi:hypothetical protein
MLVLAWTISNVGKMNPKTAVYLLFLGGSVALLALWAWALSGGIELLEFIIAMVGTAILCIFSSAIAAKKIGEDPRLSVGDVMAGANTIAFAVGLLGLCVLICEGIPSRNGPASHLDRRYSLLFFSITAYFLIFPFLTGRKIRR